MENLENNNQNETSFISNKEINDYLIETAKWGKFLAIMGYIGMGLMVLLGILMMVGLSQMSKVSTTPFPMSILGFVYIIFALVYFFPVNYLYQYSTKMKQGIHSKDILTITSGFQNLKSLFKFMGICTIVILSIYGLILIIAVPIMILYKH